MNYITNSEASLNIPDTLYAMQQKNLVYNGIFKYFSNQEIDNGSVIFNHPDGWIYSNSGKNGQIVQTDTACRIVVNTVGNPMSLTQALHEFPRWGDYLKGNTVTVNVNITLKKDTVIEIILMDGVTEIEHHKVIQEDGTYLFKLQLDMAQKANGLFLIIKSATNGAVIEILSVYGNVGKTAIETLPLMVNGIIGERKQYIATQTAPAEELSLCLLTPYELSKDQSRLNSVLNGRFGLGDNGFSLLPNVRGHFSRVWDNGSSTDPDAKDRKAFPEGSVTGDRVGTLQDDEFTQHQHDLLFSLAEPITIGEGAPAKGLIVEPHSKTQPSGGKETRPKNFSELYTIRWS